MPRVQAPSTTGLKTDGMLSKGVDIHKFEELTQPALYSWNIELSQLTCASTVASRKKNDELAARLSVVRVAFKVPMTFFGTLALVVVLLYRRLTESFVAVISHAVIALAFVYVPTPEAVMVPASDQPFWWVRSLVTL